MRKPHYNPLDLHDGFQEVIDSDFNPDIIQCFGIDMWDCGYRHGIMIGATGALMSLGTVCVAHKVYKDLKKRKSKSNK